MIEQENLKVFLKKLIDETENNHFSTAEELIKFIVMEFEKTTILIEGR